MSKIATLKKKAADLEKKSPDKAIPVYIELLGEMEKSPAEMDVALFNRVGDLLVKQGNVADAVDHYEKAVDHYVDGGFFNNAIALCNKILRSSPGRATVYYKLGKISAHKGFKADAKQNFLEYADRMQKAGKIDEAFRALGEFADLCPDQTDIRLMLADQLAKVGKKDEAIEQLQVLHEQLDGEGASAEAAAAADRMRALDPSVEPRTGGGAGKSPKGGSGDLVFLDLGDTPASVARRSVAKRATQGLVLIDTGEEAPKPKSKPTPPPAQAAPAAPAPPPPPPPAAKAKEVEPPPDLVFEPTSVSDTDEVDTGSLLELDTTSFVSSDLSDDIGKLEIESTSLADSTAEASVEEEVEEVAEPEVEAEAEPEPDVEEEALEEIVEESAGREPEVAAVDSGMLDFIMPDAADQVSQTRKSVDFPIIDESSYMPDPAAAQHSESEDSPLTSFDITPEPRLSAAERASSFKQAKSVDMLRAVVEGDPDDWAAHRELAEALLEDADREGGVRELEIAMLGYERSGDLTTAMSVADEIVRVDPSSVKHHQKRVEYAYRSNDRSQLVEAYLALADALFRAGQVDKSRTIYQRVLELSPDDLRAQAALSTMPEPAPPPPPPDRKSTTVKRASTAAPPPSRAAAPATPAKPAPPPAVGRPTPVSDDSFVNLGDWLREDEGPKDTRMVVAEEEPTGNEEADFADMLKKFKQGVAENVEAEDYQSHYDLGVAFKEMGLVDEAIAEFQKALRGPENRVRTYEAIGQCFIEKGQNQMAATILARALGEKGLGDDQLIGVLYLLGRANEAIGKSEEALTYYQRVFVVDIQFHDVADRLNALENAAR
jgi:tetratricopeptide (TPR) repeat protein